MNKVILKGRLTRDPELRYTATGTPVGTLNIAVNTKLGQDQQETLFIPITTFGKLAENCSNYLSKGSLVLVEGRLKEERWESNGQKRRVVKVIANTVQFLDKKSVETPQAAEEVEPVEPF